MVRCLIRGEAAVAKGMSMRRLGRHEVWVEWVEWVERAKERSGCDFEGVTPFEDEVVVMVVVDKGER